jgi:hypothetical protein
VTYSVLGVAPLVYDCNVKLQNMWPYMSYTIMSVCFPLFKDR